MIFRGKLLVFGGVCQRFCLDCVIITFRPRRARVSPHVIVLFVSDAPHRTQRRTKFQRRCSIKGFWTLRELWSILLLLGWQVCYSNAVGFGLFGLLSQVLSSCLKNSLFSSLILLRVQEDTSVVAAADAMIFIVVSAAATVGVAVVVAVLVS